jgi:hypothetical protein
MKGSRTNRIPAIHDELPQIRTEIDKNKADINSIPIQANESPPAPKM